MVMFHGVGEAFPILFCSCLPEVEILSTVLGDDGANLCQDGTPPRQEDVLLVDLDVLTFASDYDVSEVGVHGDEGDRTSEGGPI